jgi:hypothetical protein
LREKEERRIVSLLMASGYLCALVSLNRSMIRAS